MVPDTQHIISTLKKEEPYLKSRYFIKHLALYGSYAQKKQHPESDIDLLYTTLPEGGMTLARLRSIEHYLSQLLNIEKIELVSRQSVNPVVAKNIEDHVIPIF